MVNTRNDVCELPQLKGDGICDDAVNNWQCNFDNGDCCRRHSAPRWDEKKSEIPKIKPLQGGKVCSRVPKIFCMKS